MHTYWQYVYCKTIQIRLPLNYAHWSPKLFWHTRFFRNFLLTVGLLDCLSLIWTWRPWLHPRVLNQCKFSFQSIQRGLLPRQVKYYGFVIFSWLVTTVFYCIGTRLGRTRGWIFTVYGSYDAFLTTKCRFGVATTSKFIWG